MVWIAVARWFHKNAPGDRLPSGGGGMVPRAQPDQHPWLSSSRLQKRANGCYTDRVERTIRIRLQTTPEQTAALTETTEQFTASFNTVCQEGFRLKNGNAYTL